MSKEQMAADTAQQADAPATDWPALDRLARLRRAMGGEG